MSDLDVVRDFVNNLGGHTGECEVKADGCVQHRKVFAAKRADALQALDRLESKAPRTGAGRCFPEV